ncbi:MAG: sodium-dependent transporter [Butyricicoccaceae bacterium]
MEREKFKSRLGFILLSAGCAIGIGNIWRFPYVVGNNGGGIFVLFYLIFLIAFGIPILTMEFSIGRASKKSIICAYQELEPAGSKWHLHGWIGLLGNYFLMFFYTTVSGWMLYYFYTYLTGNISHLDTSGVRAAYDTLLSQPLTMMLWMGIVVVAGVFVCSLGLQKGVERITKSMMTLLLVLIIVLAVHSLTLSGGIDGLKFYLLPDLQTVTEIGLFNVILAAVNQSFFTLSIGIGSMMIFGSYMDRDRSLLGESVTIAALDTFVAIVAGLIIFPACFSFGINPDSGPGLVFITLPNVFNSMAGGRIWGTCFFLFMSFASFSTIIAVFENIICCCMDKWHISRKRASLVNLFIIFIGSLPCLLGFNVLNFITPLGADTNILSLEDFLVSNLALPIGSLIVLLFCTRKNGWGFDNYLTEANIGTGLKMPRGLRFYLTWILPIVLIVIIANGLVGFF